MTVLCRQWCVKTCGHSWCSCTMWTSVTIFLLAILIIRRCLVSRKFRLHHNFYFQLYFISILIYNHFTCWKLEGCLVSSNSVREHNPSAAKTLESHNKPNMYFCSTLAIYCSQLGSWTNDIHKKPLFLTTKSNSMKYLISSLILIS